MFCMKQVLTIYGGNKLEAGLKYFAPPIKQDYQRVERPKLKIMEKVPQYRSNLRPPKSQKKLKLMRGPEETHCSLLHKQYGIIATGGGRLKWGHFEMMRLTIGRNINPEKMFAVWRVPAPWFPITKKGQGQRMGGGKGAIDHYVTPIKSGRVIVEIGGKCEFQEVKPFLSLVCNQLPFSAKVVSNELFSTHQPKDIQYNQNNAFSSEYVIKNNLSGCHRWLSPFDHKWFGKYL